MSPAPPSVGINSLQSLFEYAKAATQRQPMKVGLPCENIRYITICLILRFINFMTKF